MAKSKIRVDVHLHIGNSRDGGKLSWPEIEGYLEKYEFSHGVLFPVDVLDPGLCYAKVNNEVAKVVKRDKRIIGFCRLDPHDCDVAAAELKRSMKMGLRGVKLHPRAEDFTVTEAQDLIPIIEKERLPIILHTSHEHNCHPAAWEAVFLRHKKIPFILAHAGKDAYREAAKVAMRCPNVFLDTSTLSYRRTSVLFRKVGPEKIVFASDAPYSHPAIELMKFDLILGKNEAARNLVFAENPKRILGGLS